MEDFEQIKGEGAEFEEFINNIELPTVKFSIIDLKPESSFEVFRLFLEEARKETEKVEPKVPEEVKEAFDITVRLS